MPLFWRKRIGDWLELLFPVGKKPTVGSDLGTVKFQPQAAVEIDPQSELSGITGWMTRGAFVMMCVLH